MQSSHPRLQRSKAVKPDVQKNLAPSFDRAVNDGKAGPVSFGLHSQNVLYNHGVEGDYSNIFLHLFTLKRQDPQRFQWRMLTRSPLMSWRCLPQNLLRHARRLLMTFQPREENFKGVRNLRVQRPKSWVNTQVLHPAHVSQHLLEPHPQRTCLHQKWLLMLLMLPLLSQRGAVLRNNLPALPAASRPSTSQSPWPRLSSLRMKSLMPRPWQAGLVSIRFHHMLKCIYSVHHVVT